MNGESGLRTGASSAGRTYKSHFFKQSQVVTKKSWRRELVA